MVCIVLSFWLGHAWAKTPETKFLDQKPEQYLVAKPATTTTTVPQRKQVDRVEPQAVTQTVAPSESWVEQCHAWASQAGIELPDSAITLIGRESSCNPSIMNHSGSGAGGIPQALPYTKMGCTMDEAGAPCQLIWMENYVIGRYGSWDSALAHSNATGWY